MVTLFKRAPAELEILYFENNKILRSRLIDVLRKYKIDGIIRFQEEDFKYIKQKSRLTHFSLQYSVGKRGKTYGLVRILDSGSHEDKKERQPVLDFGQMYKGICLKTKNNLTYKDIKPDDFKHSLKNIKSVKGLKKAMLRRYTKTMPGLTEDQIISLGLSIRDLQIL